VIFFKHIIKSYKVDIWSLFVKLNDTIQVYDRFDVFR